MFVCCKYVLPVMRKQKSGRIMFMSMENTDLPVVTSWVPFDCVFGKSSRVFLARSIAEREMQNGITVNAVCPTGFSHISKDEAVTLNHHEDSWTLRESCTPQDIAEAVVYLSSEAGRFVTGSMLQIRRIKTSR